MTRSARLGAVLDIAIVFVFALFLWAPWDGAADTASSPLNMMWLALPVILSRHGIHLEFATVTVTITALLAAALGALLSIAARMRGSAGLWAFGVLLFACSVAILMPMWTAVGFLGAMLLLLALRTRFVALPRTQALQAFLTELWPVGYAIGFAAFAWRYNPQLLIKALLISLGLSLVARALLPYKPSMT